jgi:hypothetical protein
MNRYKADILSLNKRDLLVWLGVSTAVVVLLIITRTPRGGGTPIAPARNTIDLVSYVLIPSLPVCLAASLLFSSKASRKRFVKLSVHEKNLRRILIIRFSSLMFLTTFYLSIVTLVFFFIQGQGSLLGIEYIPALIFAAFLVNLLLCSVGLCVALAFDDWRFSTIATCAIVFVFALFGGLFPEELRRSTVPDLALIAPHNLYRALAVAFTGYRYEPLGTMESDVGFIFEPIGLIIPVAGMIIISLLAWVLTLQLFEEDLKRWALESTVWLEDEVLKESEVQQVVDPVKQQHILNLSHASLNQQRRLAGIVIALVLIITPLGSIGYTSIRQGESVTAQYRSPAEGETVNLRQWFAVELDIPPPPEGQDNWFKIEGEILDWNGCPDTIKWHTGFNEMTLEEFHELNDTEKNELFRPWRTLDKSNPSFGTGSFNYQFSSGAWVWACCFTDPNSNSTIGYLRVVFEVTVTVR